MGIKRHTTYTIEIDDNTFEIPFEFLDSSEILEISEDGLSAKLGVLDQDEDSEDPIENFDEGELFQFDSSYIHHTNRPEIEDWKRVIRENPGRVVSIDVNTYSSDYSPRKLMTAKDTKGDKRTGENSAAEAELDNMDGYYIAPEDVIDAFEYAAGALGSYSNWAKGEVYGVCVWTHERDSIEDAWSEPDRDNECWGFIGYDYAKDELESHF